MKSQKKRNSKTPKKIASSFRDPSGFVYSVDGQLYRQVNKVYQDNYRQLMDSGLYNALTSQKLLVPHTEVDVKPITQDAYITIKPTIRIPLITYPYEWSFSQLKDAALITIAIQKIALKHGMSLKDASSYNIQFFESKPIHIDKLSFEAYEKGRPWKAYRQFCQHFLAPLALMAYKDVRLAKLSRVYLDGLPLDLCSKLLPRSSYFNLGLLTHVHMHARSQTKYANTSQKINQSQGMSRLALDGLIDSLESTIKQLKWKHTPKDTEWGNYYQKTNYSNTAAKHKQDLITKWVKKIQPTSVWDLGANDGRYSRIASSNKILTIAFDIDSVAVESNYLISKTKPDPYMLPLILDLTNPSPSNGWQSNERPSLIERGPAGLVLALALVHHLTISNNIPFDKIASLISQLSPWSIIEFVPKEDSQVRKLLLNRQDIFPNYNLEYFQKVLLRYFTIEEMVTIRQSKRTLILLKRKYQK